MIGTLTNDLNEIKNCIKELCTQHTTKTSNNAHLITTIQNSNKPSQLQYETKKLISLIIHQQDTIHRILSHIRDVRHIIDIMTHMQEAALLLHNQHHPGTLSDMVDPIELASNQFKDEIDQIQLLQDSFDIIQVELEKQKEILKGLKVHDDDIESLIESQKYEHSLEHEELLNIEQLEAFSNNIIQGITQKHRLSMLTETDKSVMDTVKSLKSRKMRRFIFSSSVYSYIKYLIRTTIQSNALHEIIFDMHLYILSRIRKWDPECYQKTINTIILCLNIGKSRGYPKDHINKTSMTALIYLIHEYLNDDNKQEQYKIMQQYFWSALAIIRRDSLMVSSMIDMIWGNGTLSVQWIKNATQLITDVQQYEDFKTHKNFTDKDMTTIQRCKPLLMKTSLE